MFKKVAKRPTSRVASGDHATNHPTEEETRRMLADQEGCGSHHQTYSALETKNGNSTKSEISNVSKLEEEERPVRRLESNLWDDAKNLREGSIPQSVAVAFVTAIACGIGAYVYYVLMTFFLELLWHRIPEKFVEDVWPEWAYALYIPLMGLLMATGLGLSVVLLGEPGDLAYTIDCVHHRAFVHINHVLPMCVASLFSIVGGGSVGPEAPLVAICAALGGNISKYIFRQTNKNVMRKHTLMGMGGALAAFFGAPLGGSLFALEVCSKFGIEYFEHVIETILCGLMCTCVYRSLTGMVIGPVWSSPTQPLEFATVPLIATSALIGFAGAFVAFLFVSFHWKVLEIFRYLGLLDNRRAVWRALLGGAVIYSIGMIVPHTMFWGEAEFQTVWTMSTASSLEHVFPTSGLVGFEMDTLWRCVLVGFLKLVAISFSVAGGYRGGFIFPLFCSGAAFGRALLFIFPSMSPTVTCLSFAAGINVAVTKTSMATTLILAYLSGEQNAMAAILSASLASLLISSYMPFIKTQVSRDDASVEMFELLYRPEEEPEPKPRLTLRGLTRHVIAAMRMQSQRDDEEVEEEDVPLADVRPAFRHHVSRSYIV